MMNILIAINDNYIRQAQMMIYSLRKSMKNEKITIYLLYKDITDKNLSKLGDYIEKKCNCEFYPILIDDQILKGLPLMEHYTYEIYYRLLASELLPDNVDRVLWLDADIIVKDDISALYYADFEDNYLIVCEDLLVNKEHIKKFIDVNATEYKYFNSGVIVFNLKKIRQDNMQKKIFEFMMNNISKLEMPDQDALNAVYFGKTKFVDNIRFNHLMLTIEKVDKKKKKQLEEDTSIIHYVGAAKPWFYKYWNSSWKYYWKIELENGNRWGYILFVTKHYIYKCIRTIYFEIKKKMK